MKTNQLVLIIALLITSVGASAQDAVRGLKFNDLTPNISVISVDPVNPNDFTVIQNMDLGFDRAYTPNTLTHVAEYDLLYFFTQSRTSMQHRIAPGFFGSQQLVVANSISGEIIKNLPFNSTTFMAPFIMPEKNRLGFITTEQGFNSYGSNSDNISLVIFDMNSGEIVHSIRLPNLSMTSVSTPFVGMMSVGKTPNGNIGSEVAISISSPLYISETQTLLISVKDVMGINRLYRFDTRNGVLLSQITLDIDVLDMVYDKSNNLIRTLYLKTEGEKRGLYVGNMSYNGDEISNEVLARELLQSETSISDGEIEIDLNTELISVMKTFGDIQIFYNYDSDLNLVSSESLNSKTEKIDFEYSKSVRSENYLDFENLVKMYPNPTSEALTIETMNLTAVNRITIYNNVGQEVKDVDVQSGTLSNTIDVSSLHPGLYMVQIQSSNVETVTKKLIVR